MNFPSLLSHALMGKKTGNKSALWGYPPVRQRLLIYSALIFTLISDFRTTQIAEIGTLAYIQGFFEARYFYLAFYNAKTFIDVKKLPSS